MNYCKIMEIICPICKNVLSTQQGGSWFLKCPHFIKNETIHFYIEITISESSTIVHNIYMQLYPGMSFVSGSYKEDLIFVNHEQISIPKVSIDAFNLNQTYSYLQKEYAKYKAFL